MNFRKIGLNVVRTLLAVPATICMIGISMNYSGLASKTNASIEAEAAMASQALYDQSWMTPLSDPASADLFRKAQSIKPNYGHPVYVISTIGASFEKLPLNLIQFNKKDIDGNNKVSLIFCIVAGGTTWFVVILSGILYCATFEPTSNKLTTQSTSL